MVTAILLSLISFRDYRLSRYWMGRTILPDFFPECGYRNLLILIREA